MKEFAFAQLTNLLYEFAIGGEILTRAFIGDAEGVIDSIFALILNSFTLLSYTLGNNIKEQNVSSAVMNAISASSAYISQLNRPTKSITYAILPLLGTIQIATNALEYSLRGKLKT